MNTSPAASSAGSPLATRLVRLNPLAANEPALIAPERECRTIAARRELIAEGQPVRERRALSSGWACRYRILKDGQRQILGFLLPGDLIGMHRHRNPLAMASMMAITEVVTCAVPVAGKGSELAEAYALSDALDRFYLLAHITRLGRLDAYQRLGDWLLETHDRLALAGLAANDSFQLPLTQELLADTLGLTSVHVNRTLQAMRRDGLIALQRGVISFSDRIRLVRLVSYKPPCVGLGD